MKTETHHSPSRDMRLDEVLADYLGRAERGQKPDQAEWLAQHPAYRAELERFFAQEHELEALAAPLRAAAGASGEVADLPAQLGDFQIIREIGRGGMGIVYEAEQLSIGRHVALKVLPFAALLDPKALQRFKNEVRAVGTLDHPNIVHVHFVGEERSVYFYAMQLIRGQSLAEVIASLRESVVSGQLSVAAGSVVSSQLSVAKDVPANDNGPLTTDKSEICNLKSALETQPIAALTTEYTTNPKRYFRRVAELGIQAAEALDHAHQLGIVHRDVKPSNLMLDEGGKLYVTDFGLARVGTDPSMTMTGDLVGTLRYMSPEQVEGKSAVLDHRTDVYSLGVTLYEMLALRPAFDGKSREALLQQITEATPPPLRKSNPATPAELETIVHKAIEKDAADRYSSAADLAADLRRFLENKPLAARPPSLWHRTRKWARRHPAALVSAACVLFVALVAALAAAGIANQERSRTAAALQEKGRALTSAEANLDLAVRAVDGMYAELAMSWLANETAPSTMQRRFLQFAIEFYEQIASRPPSTQNQRAQAARIHCRIAQIQEYLGNPAEAVAAARRSIDVGEGLVAEKPDEEDLWVAMPERYLALARPLAEMGDYAAAEEAYQKGLVYLDRLARAYPSDAETLVFRIQFYHGQADFWIRTDRLDRAEAAVSQSAECIGALNDRKIGNVFLDEPNRYLHARVLHAKDEHVTAREEAEKALKGCRRLRKRMYADAREPAELEIDILQLLGEISEAEGKLAQAAAYYRNALDLRLALFKAHREPADFIVQTFIQKQANVDGQFEHGPFCRYIETQYRLARVLRKLGRTEEAEHILGECWLATQVIWADRENVLRYHVADANAWALAAELLVELQRPNEAEAALAHARLIWQDTLARFGHAAEYKSGVHGQASDLDWFRQLLPGEPADSLVARAAPVHDRITRRPQIPFAQGATDRSWRDASHDAEVRKTDRASAWLHRSLSHALLGEEKEARRWLDKAGEAMQSMKNPPTELQQLRDETDRMLSSPLPLDGGGVGGGGEK